MCFPFSLFLRISDVRAFWSTMKNVWRLVATSTSQIGLVLRRTLQDTDLNTSPSEIFMGKVWPVHVDLCIFPHPLNCKRRHCSLILCLKFLAWSVDAIVTSELKWPSDICDSAQLCTKLEIGAVIKWHMDSGYPGLQNGPTASNMSNANFRRVQMLELLTRNMNCKASRRMRSCETKSQAKYNIWLRTNGLLFDNRHY